MGRRLGGGNRDEEGMEEEIEKERGFSSIEFGLLRRTMPDSVSQTCELRVFRGHSVRKRRFRNAQERPKVLGRDKNE